MPPQSETPPSRRLLSIVKDTPGVTRDRIYADVSWLNYNFTMIDTGGIEPESNDIILSQMREQAQIAIDTADVIMFIVDVRQGLQDADSKVADMLRRSHKPIVLVVNTRPTPQTHLPIPMVHSNPTGRTIHITNKNIRKRLYHII